MIKLDNDSFVYRNLHFKKPFYFGKGINPHSITALRGNYVEHAKPLDDESMESQEDDDFRYWLLYDLLPGWMSVIQLFLFCSFLTYLSLPMIPKAWVETASAVMNECDAIGEGCPPLSYWEIFYFWFGAILLFVVALVLLSGRIYPPLRTLGAYKTKIDAGHSAFRENKTYNSKLHRFDSLLDMYQASSSTIAFLQEDKIHVYDFKKRIREDFIPISLKIIPSFNKNPVNIWKKKQ